LSFWQNPSSNVASKPKKSKLMSMQETNVIFGLITKTAFDVKKRKFLTFRWFDEFFEHCFPTILLENVIFHEISRFIFGNFQKKAWEIRIITGKWWFWCLRLRVGYLGLQIKRLFFRKSSFFRLFCCFCVFLGRTPYFEPPCAPHKKIWSSINSIISTTSQPRTRAILHNISLKPEDSQKWTCKL